MIWNQAASIQFAAQQTYLPQYKIPSHKPNDLKTTTHKTQVIDRFITSNQDYHNQLLCHFVLIDNLTETYDHETEIGDMEDEQNRTITSPDSPFKNKTPAECQRLLFQLRQETDSDIDYTSFVIMDERSLQDDTVLLVLADDGEAVGDDGICSIRVSFEIAQWRLSGYMIGDLDPGEDKWTAEERTEDGVLRDGMDLECGCLSQRLHDEGRMHGNEGEG